MFRPVLITNTQKNLTRLLFLATDLPLSLKKMVGCIVAYNSKKMHIGAGTFVGNAFLTASHIFSFNFEQAVVVCYVSPHTVATIPVVSVSMYPERDIAKCQVSIPPFIKPAGLITETTEIPITKLYAFGCPQGLFGIYWKPAIVSQTAELLVSQGMAIPGVSGGGILAKLDKNWYLIAIHSFAILETGTLYSYRIP
ncbi:trypsin-like peptidase domain-containing protein [Candidatus Bathyarchaeota archaeon]|nr:trypsin-like peptidase domain-containing protein [Candidatus Bathyarchaeota archaeon]